MWGVLVVMLVGYSILDIRKKSLPVLWVAAGLAIALAVGTGHRMLTEDIRLSVGVLRGMWGMLPGMAFVLLALVLKESIGVGDGWILAVIGGMVGFRYATAILMAALFMSFFYSCALLVFYKKAKNHRFPFVPFYLCGTVLVFLTMAM